MHTLIIAAALCQFDIYGSSDGDAALFDIYGTTEVAVAADAKPDERPTVILYSTPGCRPCMALKKLIEAGALPEFRFDYRLPEDWVELTPLLHYHTSDGWKQFRAHQFPTDKIPEEFRKAWAKWQAPKAQLASVTKPVRRSGLYYSGNSGWTWPGDLRSHLASEHGVSMATLNSWSDSQCIAYHDATRDVRITRAAGTTTRRRGLFGNWFCPTCPN